MKKLLLIALCLLGTLAIYAQNTFYYGADGQKIYLKEKPNTLLLKKSDKLRSNPSEKIVADLDDYKIVEANGKSNLFESTDGSLKALSNSIFIKSDNDIEEILNKVNLMSKVTKIEHFDPDINLYIVHFNTDQTIELVNQLWETGMCEFAEPAFIRIAEASEETQAKATYAMDLWGLTNIDADGAWTHSTGQGIIVAVLDDGADYNHPSLRSNLIAGFDATTDNNESAGACGYQESHGTMCAGLVAANSSEYKGIAPSAKVMPVRIGKRVNNYYKSIDTWVIKGFKHAYENGADVLSNSWYAYENNSALAAVIQQAMTKGRNGKGSVVVFCAGNDGSSIPSFPRNTGSIIVGSSDKQNKRAAFSNYGKELSVVAPGTGIWSTGTDGRFLLDNGTSYSCPYVSGIAALILSVNPNLTNSDVRCIIERTAKKIGGYNYNLSGTNGSKHLEMGYGRVDAREAVEMAKEYEILPNINVNITISDAQYVFEQKYAHFNEENFSKYSDKNVKVKWYEKPTIAGDDVLFFGYGMWDDCYYKTTSVTPLQSKPTTLCVDIEFYTSKGHLYKTYTGEKYLTPQPMRREIKIKSSDNIVCNNTKDTLYIENIPSGLDIEWIYDSNKLILESGQGVNYAIFSGNGDGSTLLKANIKYKNKIYQTVEDYIWVGIPEINFFQADAAPLLDQNAYYIGLKGSLNNFNNYAQVVLSAYSNNADRLIFAPFADNNWWFLKEGNIEMPFYYSFNNTEYLNARHTYLYSNGNWHNESSQVIPQITILPVNYLSGFQYSNFGAQFQMNNYALNRNDAFKFQILHRTKNRCGCSNNVATFIVANDYFTAQRAYDNNSFINVPQNRNLKKDPTIKVYSFTTGSLVHREQDMHINNFDIQHTSLSNGIYIIEYKDEEGNVNKKKVMKK